MAQVPHVVSGRFYGNNEIGQGPAGNRGKGGDQDGVAERYKGSSFRVFPVVAAPGRGFYFGHVDPPVLSWTS